MFHFNLQPLLNHRQLEEKILKKELAESERTLEVERQKLKNGKKRINGLIRDMETRVARGATAFELQMYARSHGRMAEKLDEQRQRIVEITRLSDEKRCHLVDAMKRKKSVERLKEKRFREYRQETNRQEQEFSNEMAIQRFNRKT